MENRETITVAILNATYMQIAAEPHVIKELNEFFSFDVPGAKFMPLYKHKAWDGKKRLFNIMNQTLYVGLYFLLKRFADDRGYIINNLGESIVAPKEKHDIGEIRAFLESLNLQSKNVNITPHPYQEEAIQYCINNKRTTVVSPTSSGKSLIIYSVIRWYLEKNPSSKILLIVPTVSLVLQMYSDFEDYSTNNGWNTEENCHKIYGGQEKESPKRVLISTWQSMQNRKPAYFQKFDIVINDEVHQAAATEITKIMESSSNAYIRYGFTGTLQDTKCHKLVILGHFGEDKKIIDTRDLMDKGFISQLLINCVVFEYNEEDARQLAKTISAEKRKNGKKSPGSGYSIEIDFIVSHKERMDNLIALILSLKNNSLVLFNLVDKHGKVIYNRLIEEIQKRNLDKNVLYVSGEIKPQTREEIRLLMEKTDNNILVASYGTTSTGINIKNLHNVIFASPSKSKIKVLQSIGRGLRKNNNKEQVVLFDVIDKITYFTKKGNEKQNYVFNHFWERWKLYKNEKFNYKIFTRKFK